MDENSVDQEKQDAVNEADEIIRSQQPDYIKKNQESALQQAEEVISDNQSPYKNDIAAAKNIIEDAANQEQKHFIVKVEPYNVAPLKLYAAEQIEELKEKGELSEEEHDDEGYWSLMKDLFQKILIDDNGKLIDLTSDEAFEERNLDVNHYELLKFGKALSQDRHLLDEDRAMSATYLMSFGILYKQFSQVSGIKNQELASSIKDLEEEYSE